MAGCKRSSPSATATLSVDAGLPDRGTVAAQTAATPRTDAGSARGHTLDASELAERRLYLDALRRGRDATTHKSYALAVSAFDDAMKHAPESPQALAGSGAVPDQDPDGSAMTCGDGAGWIEHTWPAIRAKENGMSWDVVVRAQVKFPKGGLSKWRAAAPAFLKDAPKTFPKAMGKLPKTVAKILSAIPEYATYLKTTTKSEQWTLAALLSEDDFIDFGPVLAAVTSAAAAGGGEGELLCYGFDTAPAGIAYRIGVKAGAVAFESVSSADEKKLASSREGTRFAAFVASCVRKEEQALMPKSAAAFYKGMEGVKPLVAEALAFIQRADDKTLVRIVQKQKLYSFYPPSYKTAKAIKSACRPDGKKLDYPKQAMGDVLRIIARLDHEKALSLARRIAESQAVPTLFWDACAEILAPSPLAPIFVKRFWRVRADEDWVNLGKNPIKQWGEFLGGSKAVTNELLQERLRHALAQAAKLKGDASNGAGQVAAYLAAALLLQRRQWKLVPEIAKACFGHPNFQLRGALQNVIAELPPQVPVPAPRLDAVEREGLFPQLDTELERRLARDPKKAYEELHALLESGDYPAREAAFSALGRMTRPARAVVDKKEPRWKAWGKKHPGA